MSKIKFAALGVAALGVAALPVAASYATEYTSSPAAGDVTYQAVIEDSFAVTIDDAGNTVSYTLVGGEAAKNTEKTSIKVVTNHSTGYNITAQSKGGSAIATTGATASNALQSKTDKNDAIDYSTTAISGVASSAWNLTADKNFSVPGVIDLKTAQATTIHTQNGPTTSAGVEGTITYTAVAADGQDAGTYDNVVTYTVTENA